MMGGGYWTPNTKYISDTQFTCVNGNGTATSDTTSYKRNVYRRLAGGFLDWEFCYVFSGVPSSSGAMIAFQLPLFNGTTLSVDTARIQAADATTNAASPRFGEAHYWNGSTHTHYWVFWASGLSTSTLRKQHVKILQAGGTVIVDTSLTVDRHIQGRALIPIEGWD